MERSKFKIPDSKLQGEAFLELGSWDLGLESLYPVISFITGLICKQIILYPGVGNSEHVRKQGM